MKKRHKSIYIKSLLLAVCLAVTALVPAVQAEASSGKKTVYVVTECTQDGSEKTTYKYNSDGLVTKKTSPAGVTNYYYKNKRLVKEVEKDPLYEEDQTITYSYDKKGRICKYVIRDNKTNRTTGTVRVTYDGKNRIQKLAEDRGSSKVNYSMKYNGTLLRKMTATVKGTSTKETYRFTYNGKRYIRKIKYPWATVRSTFSYKHGRISKRTEKTTYKDKSTSKSVYKYSYKKMRVPKSRANQIKEQQRSILEIRWNLFN